MINHKSADKDTSTSVSARRARRDITRWRVVDIITAAVLGVATGLIFWAWNGIGGAWYTAMDSLLPGIGGLVTGIWLLGGVLGGTIIRKPGAAIMVEVIAAIISAVLGNQWGITTVYSGLAQGVGAELVFVAFLYARYSLVVAVLSGIGASAVEWCYEWASGNYARSMDYNMIYLASLSISGAVLAGVLGFYLVRALATAGALDRFAAGRESAELV
ncbi:ECF transporter S component [Corynebacterium kroppenstedtii]|uniref:ECF transporter S component n=1 Tax=Corynebacterium sp. PCR 32 TaxID=3351342 RepID=UPI0030B1F482